MIENIDWIDLSILIGGYSVLLLTTSGLILNYILSKVSKETMTQKIGKDARDTGFVVGKGLF